jgi:tRNA threonylcarbamoyladenosine biosynthesis protein TsaB
MKILSLDTSGPVLTMAVSENKEILFEYERQAEKSGNKILFSMLEEVLARAKLSLREIDIFAVGIGPGSFTGTRLALTVMKGLAYAQSRPIIGVSSLDILAFNLQGEVRGLICPIVDAKRGSLYSAIYRKEGDRLERLSDYLLISLEELLERLSANVFFLGDGIDLYRRSLLKKIPQAKIAAQHLWYPKAANLCIIANERKDAARPDAVFTLVPMYLYPQDCSVHIKKN